MYLISIIIPTFNGEKTLTDTLNSVIAQPIFPNCEVIIINDGSTDKTEELCFRFSRKHDNIHVVTQENMGVSMARNNGLMLAQSQYVMFLDADDFYVDNALNEELLHVLEGNYDIILFSGYISNLTRDRYGVYMRCRDAQMKGGRVLPMPELFGAGIYRREMLLENDIRFPENIRMNEDQVFVVESLYAARTIKTCSSFLYIYNKNMESVSVTLSGEKFYDAVLAWKKAKDWFDSHAVENKEQMLQYVQWKINSRTLLYAKHYVQSFHWVNGLKKQLEKHNELGLLLDLKPNQVMPYQVKDLQAFQSNLTLFVLRAKIEGLIVFFGRKALRISAIRRWRDKKVYPYTKAGLHGPV